MINSEYEQINRTETTGLPELNWVRRCKFIRALDGDTVELEMDMGLRGFQRLDIRLMGIDAPEKHEPGGPEAMAYLIGLLEGKRLLIQTVKTRNDNYRMSFTRYLAIIWEEGARKTISTLMVQAGHAVRI